MHIELHRTFRELLQKEHVGDTGALFQSNASLTLPELLNELRVVILSEAGSGKTEEIREAARRLRREGKAAFFLRLEHVAVDFNTAFEEGTIEEFNAWLDSSESGWVLLDSIDESRLRSSADFASALRIVNSRLVVAKQRTHLMITGRMSAWRPKSDLDLCNQLFPIATGHAAEANNGPMFGHKTATGSSYVSYFKIVSLENLAANQIKNFATEKGIDDTQAFLDAIERADAWSFTARPQDLDELTGFWLDNGRIGSRLDLMANSVNHRVRESDQTRAEASPLSHDKALEGAQIIAAALMLSRQQTIQVPDGIHSGGQGLKLGAVLPGWTDKQITTLLQRPLFAPDIYSTVRFHHSSVKEYLAAQWFLKLLAHERSRSTVEGLLFREQYGIEVIVPSLRPLLPWLAMADSRILARVRCVAPEIVFEGGDPVQLPVVVRLSILEQVCDQLATGASTRSMGDFAAIQRFAAADLTDTVRRLAEKFQANDDIVFFLMRMVWQGRLAGALPVVMNVARSASAVHSSRIAAFRAIGEVGTREDMASIRDVFAKEGDNLNRKCMADLVSHIQQPDEQTLQWLLNCIPRLATVNEFESTGLSEEIASYFERADIILVAKAIDRLHELLITPPVIERRFCRISEHYQWLCRAAGVAVRRVINARDSSALSPSSLAVLHVLPLIGQYNYLRIFDVKKLGLAEVVQKWTELKWALFWHVVGQERQSMLTTTGEPMIDAWIALIAAIYISFDSNDFDAAIEAIGARALADDKQVALSLAFRLYIQTDRQRSRIAEIKKAVSVDEILKKRLAELIKPPKKPDLLKKLERENARWTRIGTARHAGETKARLEAPSKLEAQLDLLRNPGFDDSSHISNGQRYLFDRMRELEGSKSSRWTEGNWRALEGEFGTKTPRAFRDGMVAFWRRHVPMLVSEGATLNTTSLADQFGLAGLTIEAAEAPSLFKMMSPAEAALSFRYAMIELNGFPHWFPALSDTHLDLIKIMALDEVTFELNNDSDSDGAQRQYIIADLSQVGDWLWDILAPEIIGLLRKKPVKNAERLRQLVNIVQASKLPDSEIATLAAEKMTAAGDLEHWPLWAATWTGVDPDLAIDALETHLAKLGDAERRTQFTMSYVTHLLGGSHMSSRVRGKFRSPAVLKRLYILVHEHVRSHDDIDRANKGAYSPGLRDNAQDARERLVNLLVEIPGKDSYLALKMISEAHPEPRPSCQTRCRLRFLAG